MISSRVNTAVWNKLVKRLGEAAGARVRTGVLAEAGGTAVHPDSDLTMIELAAIHEIGSPAAGIKERSFIRSTANRPDVTAKLGRLAAQLVKKLVANKLRPEQALGQMGALMASEIKRTIRARKTVGPESQPNAASTILKKGSSTPLVDTGRLINAITWVVVRVVK